MAGRRTSGHRGISQAPAHPQMGRCDWQERPVAAAHRATIAGMNTAPITGTRYDDVVHDALAVAQAGDYRARHVTVGSRAGIVTPHRDENGQLDRNDLAAQIYALAHGLASDNGQYTGGAFVSGSEGYFIAAPDTDQE